MPETRRQALGLAALAIVAAVSPSLGADALGDARLFFTPAERGVTEPESRGDERADGDGIDGESGGGEGVDGERMDGTQAERERRGDERNASVSTASSPSRRDGAGIDPSARHPSDAPTSAKRRPPRDGGFEALLRTGERVRVVVGGEHCRGVRDVPDLHCERLPEGVRAFALDGRRLVVTFRDGRRRRLVVGESLRP